MLDEKLYFILTAKGNRSYFRKMLLSIFWMANPWKDIIFIVVIKLAYELNEGLKTYK